MERVTDTDAEQERLKEHLLQPWIDQVIEGDCLPVMREMPSQSVPLIITAPPLRMKPRAGGGRSRWPTPSEYWAWQAECLQEMHRLLTQDGAIYYSHLPQTLEGRAHRADQAMRDLPLRQVIIWTTGNTPSQQRAPHEAYAGKHETIYLIAKNYHRLTDEAHALGDYWYIPQTGFDPEHPRAFPKFLPQQIIEAEAGAEVVLDPFAGVGTTACVAKSMGRRWIAIEQNTRYCMTARRRLDETRRRTAPTKNQTEADSSK